MRKSGRNLTIASEKHFGAQSRSTRDKSLGSLRANI